ncbi:MAG: AmmeMemoRadiSam system radical SAM enzyme [Thermodesulfobacteriota bacterium]|nr:AmmeMemoRadiSam system radical SAM enzyme [Thermodesulfobacteriota bacterium]
MKEALFYEKLGEHKVQCNLCNHRCTILSGKVGICGVRENRNGILYSLVYGKTITENVDPIEKKPLFHFYPGSKAFSIATVGCNFKCSHCQNSDISQMPRDAREIVGRDISPQDVVSLAKRYGCTSISYTYTEPTIFFEFVYDTAILAKKEGISNNFVTNGYITKEALQYIRPFLDAANIDLKSFSSEFYQKICGAKLEPVLDSIKLYKELGIWVELTTLIIPNYNDSEDELSRIAEFIKELGVETPWHVTRFHPTFRLKDQPHTPVTTLKRAREIGLSAGLRYVYEGNVPGEGGENTYCYHCKELLIERRGFSILKNSIANSRCPECASVIDGIGMS